MLYIHDEQKKQEIFGWNLLYVEETYMEQDMLLQRYLADNERYADLINGFGFAGRKVVAAEDLTEMDTQTGYWFSPSFFRVRKSERRQKYRDLIRKTAFGINFVVVGVENQTEVHYLMPLRTMAYDVGEYERQAAIIRKRIRKRKGISRGEFLSGFAKNSRLHPCVTIVLFYGKCWDGSRDLHGILDFADIPEEMKGLVNNYRINLLEIRKLTDTNVFRTDLRQVFEFIRCSEDKVKLKELVEGDRVYSEMEEDAYDVAVAFTKADELIDRKKFHEKGGKVNMCKALTELLEDERTEGRIEGVAEGEERFASLSRVLVESGRTEELLQASMNREYRERLYKELDIA